MFASPCSARHARTRHFPRFDSLEGRITLSGDGSPGNTSTSALLESTTADVGPQTEQGPLAVNLIDPAPNSVLTASPASLLLEFNRPIFADTVDNDVLLVQTDPEGNPISFTNPVSLTVDPTATQLSAALSGTLAPGHYQVWILGTSAITDLDGNYLTDGSTNLVVGQFEVATPGVRLADAVDLANPGSTPEEIAGALNFQNPSQAVALYRIQLDPGHLWRLGLEATPRRAGKRWIQRWPCSTTRVGSSPATVWGSPLLRTILTSLPVSNQEPTTLASPAWETCPTCRVDMTP